MWVEDLTGVTEIRPGNYALFDIFQAGIGSCNVEDIALSVVTEVIGVYAERGVILVDAGALALSKDPGPRHVQSDIGFGRVCTLDGTPLSGFSLVGLSQEHGKVSVPEEAAVAGTIRVGDRLRILPNHSCLVTALHDRLHVLEDDVVIATWHPVRGW